MIVESTVEMRVGETFELHEWELDDGPTVPAVVLREATEEEYVAWCAADLDCPGHVKEHLAVLGTPGRRWYEVSTD